MKNLLLLCAILITMTACQENVPDEKVEAVAVSEYSEPHRPQYHFSPPEKWMNDPNGMVYYDGEYHLFYQYYPDSTVWGPMHWGHAVTRDLMHWEHLPIALYPDSLGYIFSGSAVVDWKNTSGFGKDGEPPLVAIFTHHNMAGEKTGKIDFQYQSIAYSNDKGRRWTKYKGNPVVPNPGIKDFRDPKVIWDDNSGQWVMVLAAQDQVKFYGSKNLKNWTMLSDFGKNLGSHGGVWECPDLFPLKVEGTGGMKWVLLVSINPGGPNGGSATQYFVGDFDGKNFNLDPGFKNKVTNEQAVWLDWGRDNYAGVTWSDMPEIDGRRIFLGWMSNWDYAKVVPTEKWRSAMTLPRELRLKKTDAGFRIFTKPARELELNKGKYSKMQTTRTKGRMPLASSVNFSPTQMEALLEFTGDMAVELSNKKGEVYRIGYNSKTNEYYSDRTRSGELGFSDKFAAAIHKAPGIVHDSTKTMHIFFDVASAELFADDGQTVLTDIFFPTEDFTKAELVFDGKLIKADFNEMKRVW